MNCLLKVNDPTGEINRIHECTGDGWIRYYIDTKGKTLDGRVFQGTASNGTEVHKFIHMYVRGNRTAVEFHTEEPCELVIEEDQYSIIAILIADRIIGGQEEVYPALDKRENSE